MILYISVLTVHRKHLKPRLAKSGEDGSKRKIKGIRMKSERGRYSEENGRVVGERATS